MIRRLIITLLFASIALFAQDTTQNPSPGTTPSGTPSPHHHAMQGSQAGSGMQAMHGQMMQEMKQNLEKMKSLLQEMKTNAAGLTGKEKGAMDANVQLWQMMIDHMDQMVNHMSSMQGGMMGGEMDHSKMHGNQSAPTAPPKQ